jgi:hypothetical protein
MEYVDETSGEVSYLFLPGMGCVYKSVYLSVTDKTMPFLCLFCFKSLTE